MKVEKSVEIEAAGVAESSLDSDADIVQLRMDLVIIRARD